MTCSPKTAVYTSLIYLFRYCNKDKPVYNYPGISHTFDGTGNMKMWFNMKAYPGMYPDRKAVCTVVCNSGNYGPPTIE